MEPMQVADFGTMCLARDPGGVVFGVWQAGTHEGFQAMAEPGAYTWAEVFTREPGKSDAFFPAVFSYRQRDMEDGEMDFRIYDLGERTVLGRMKMDDDFRPRCSRTSTSTSRLRTATRPWRRPPSSAACCGSVR